MTSMRRRLVRRNPMCAQTALGRRALPGGPGLFPGQFSNLPGFSAGFPDTIAGVGVPREALASSACPAWLALRRRRPPTGVFRRIRGGAFALDGEMVLGSKPGGTGIRRRWWWRIGIDGRPSRCVWHGKTGSAGSGRGWRARWLSVGGSVDGCDRGCCWFRATCRGDAYGSARDGSARICRVAGSRCC